MLGLAAGRLVGLGLQEQVGFEQFASADALFEQGGGVVGRCGWWNGAGLGEDSEDARIDGRCVAGEGEQDGAGGDESRDTLNGLEILAGFALGERGQVLERHAVLAEVDVVECCAHAHGAILGLWRGLAQQPQKFVVHADAKIIEIDDGLFDATDRRGGLGGAGLPDEERADEFREDGLIGFEERRGGP